MIIECRELWVDDVLIDIKFSGICYFDIYSVFDEWGGGMFLMVFGYEIVGVVEVVGENVIKYKVGDCVGVGCFVDFCGECEYCVNGDE